MAGSLPMMIFCGAAHGPAFFPRLVARALLPRPVALTYGVIRQSRVPHISRRTSEIPRISCTLRQTGRRVRFSVRKGAWSSRNPRTSTGNWGCGAPGFGERTRHLGRRSILLLAAPWNRTADRCVSASMSTGRHAHLEHRANRSAQ